MDELIRFVKQHRRQITRLAKKAFTWWKKNKGGGGGQQQGGASYGQAASYGQEVPYQPQQGGYGGGYAPPQGDYSVPQQQHGAHSQGPHYKFSQDDQVNQHDANYLNLRNQARSEGDKMAQCFDQSHKAYAQGDGARAKQLSNEGNTHKANMERLNKQAADWIFMANNEDSPPGTVDLHGLYTSEALERTEQAVRQGQSQGWSELRIIVGKGLHSKDHRQHIAPAVEKLMRDYRLDAHIDPRNAGVLVVNLKGSGQTGAGFTRDLAKQTTGNEDECVIM